jgi:hypothetical protein
MKAMQAKAQGRANKMGRKMPDTPFQKEVRKSESDKKKKVNKVKNLPSNPKAKEKMRYLKKKAK